MFEQRTNKVDLAVFSAIIAYTNDTLQCTTLKTVSAIALSRSWCKTCYRGQFRIRTLRKKIAWFPFPFLVS